MTTAIRLQHLQRPAYVYLRQSTPGQVHTHRESTERQYALAEQAVELGWDRSQVHILDQDLGKSGTTTEGRTDFHRFMAAVGLGEVGAVFALEASRLSRSQADWHKLMDICALTDTLIVDQDGIYDPNAFNDRVLLGFKGTWSHTELHALRLRLQDAKLHKARKGELRCNPPTGYIYDAGGALVLDPDESVVAAVARLFQQCQELGSAFGVMRVWAAQGLPFPRRQWLPGASGALAWGRLSLSRVLAILHNPRYTGTYVYGRRRSQPVVEAGQVTRIRTLHKPQPEWTVVIPDAHPAYISWEQYVANIAQLTRNRTNLPSVPGRPREGAALLQGLVLCGRCGRRMSVRYQGTGGRHPIYECQRRRLHDGQGGICWSVPARPIDAAVAAHVLAAVTPANLELALEVLTQFEQDAAERDHQWQLQLERARYEAQRAERQYDVVDPEHRLVARTLERRWNEKLQQLQALEQAYTTAQRTQRLDVTPQERQQILRLAADLPAVWRAPTTTQAERKELLGLLLKQIALTPVEAPQRQTRIHLLWHTTATTDLTVARQRSPERVRTPPQVIEAIAILAVGRTDAAIAKALNAQGLSSGRGRPFTAKAVAWIRHHYQIRKPGSDRQVAAGTMARADGRYSTRALATRLGVSIATVHYWREHGVLPAIQELPGGPWWHEITPEILERLRTHIRRAPVQPTAFDPQHFLVEGAL
jgi:DNA invertase Pin-like site-specific DNA recombinase